MRPELTPAALVLLTFLAALLVRDVVAHDKSKRLLATEIGVFALGGALILFPSVASSLARMVGIGRGVDFVLYPLVILLVREALLSRRRRHLDDARLTEVVRALALANATARPAAQSDARDSHPSTTT